ncbi:unnamed protein product [Spirodela intermedia]|uniref:EF-hand domain-containing protein n=1 Tax=Spirodela intermedia TaxID=51605 RepID=A0A7I8J3G4_SPIIN|nr:unnamed protein product [Spirodela intermedia]CAA6664786.1 unnamed protein product [Spirodela intermedia]
MGLAKIFCGLGSGERKKKAVSPLHSPPSSRRSSSSASAARSPEEEMERVFRKFDANGDGKISAEEIGRFSSLHAMVAEADADGDGFIDLAEFVALNTRGVGAEAAVADLHWAFSVFDANGDGAITAEEVWRVLRSLGEEASLRQCRRMVRSVDRDGDGVVSLEEFTAMMMGNLSWARSPLGLLLRKEKGFSQPPGSTLPLPRPPSFPH